MKYTDDFSTPASLSNYTVAGGTWSVQNGQLYGFYPITIGGVTDPQGDLLLLPQFQPQSADWKCSFDFNYQQAQSGYDVYQAWGSVIIWFSATEKYEILVGHGGNAWDGAPRADISVRAEGYPWNEYATETLPLNWNPRAENRVEFAKVGNDVRVSVNGTYLTSIPVPFSGRQAMLGFHVYGSVLFDNLEIDEVTDGTADLCASELASLQSQIASLTATNQSLQDQLTTANQQISQLNANLQAVQTANQTLQSQNTALQSQLADAQATIANLQGQVSTLAATNQSLQTQLATTNNQISSLESSLAAANAQIATLTAQNSQLTAANQALQTQLTQANAQITQLTSDLKVAQAANQALQAQNTSLQSTLDAANTQITTLTAQNAQLTASNQMLTAQNSAMIAQVTALNQFFATIFNDPTFQLPGSTPQQQLQNLVTAIQQLNHGQQQALFKNLGG